jgi:DNA-binding NarL/FixJ family response regulator
MTTLMPLRIYIIDDHEDVRRALAARLGSCDEMLVVGDTADAECGVLAVRELHPNVVLVETKRGDGRGLELVSLLAQGALAQGALAQGALAQGSAAPRVVVLTSYPSEWERWAALRAGAVCYLLKDIGSPQLIEQIRTAALPSSAAAVG